MITIFPPVKLFHTFQDPYEELEALYNQNIDGFFTDYPESLTKFLDCKYD